jgi:hypothetical protein
MRARPGRPIAARLRRDGRELQVVLDLSGVFEDVDVEAGRDVPSDVAMERPDAWVVGVDLNDNVRGFGVADRHWQKLHVASLRVLAVRDGAVECSGPLSKNVPTVVSECRS